MIKYMIKKDGIVNLFQVIISFNTTMYRSKVPKIIEETLKMKTGEKPCMKNLKQLKTLGHVTMHFANRKEGCRLQIGVHN